MTSQLALFIITCFASASAASLSSGQGKNHFLMQAVGKSGVSLHAKSFLHCKEFCETHKNCDAANFHTPSGKCRLLLRCSPYRLVESNKHHHFAKRPPMLEKGFTYDDNTDSCLKVLDERSNYQEADDSCQHVGGRLAALIKPEINKLATKLLRDTKVQYAWIGLTDIIEEGNPVHSSGMRVSEAGFFPRAKQGSRDDPTRNCWSLTDHGEWVEQSCKDKKHYSICQVPAY